MALDYEKLKKERITGTKIAPYHMITAVTQRSINHQLAKMWKVNRTLQILSIKAGDKDDNYSELKADLNAPTIELRLGTESRIVIFCFNIKRATLKYLKIKGRTVTEEQLELPSCVLALSVNLAFEEVDFQNLPQGVQDCLKVKDNYSVQQLLIDFNSASLARLDTQRTAVQDYIEDPVAQGNFNLFMQKYFTVLGQNKDAFVLHYIPLATKEGQKSYAMPTIPPTDLMFENLPFVTSTTDNGKASDDNMLVYLQMTSNGPIARELLSISANWVVPTPDNTGRYDGTVALSRKIFVEGWLLPKLTEINKRSSYVVTDAWWKTKPLSHIEFFLDGHLGRNDATEAELLFTPRDAAVYQVVDGEVVAPPPGHWYQYGFISSKEYDLAGWKVSLSSTTQNYLLIPEGYNDDGKCEIRLFGSTSLHFYVHVVDLPASSGSVQGEWSTSIILDGINDGGLVIKINDMNVKIIEKIDKAWLDKKEITHFSNPAKEGLKALSMTYLLAQMRDVLTGGWQFVFPAGGDFYISKAVFNREEDLLCELKYKFMASFI